MLYQKVLSTKFRNVERIANLEDKYSSWVFGFRTNFAQSYKQPDNHLRFG